MKMTLLSDLLPCICPQQCAPNIIHTKSGPAGRLWLELQNTITIVSDFSATQPSTVETIVKVPPECRDLAEVFSKQKATELPSH